MNKTTILYDGKCHLCYKEVQMYLKQDKDDKLHVIDISSKNFDAEKFGLSNDMVQKHLHVLTPQGEVAVGIDAFVAIWKVLPYWKNLAPIADFSPLKLILSLSYKGFAEIRPYLPKRKNHCPDGECEYR